MDTAAAERKVVTLPARSPLHLTPNLPEDEGNKQAPPTLSTPGWGWRWSSKGAVTLYGASLGWTVPMLMLGRRGTLGTSSCQGCGWVPTPSLSGTACKLLIIAMAVTETTAAGHVPGLCARLPISGPSLFTHPYPHLKDEETEAQKGEAPGPGSQLGSV